MEATIFNPIQLQLLQMFSHVSGDEELREVQTLLSDYYFNRVERLAAELYHKKGWTQETLESLSNAHLRTPYK